MEIIKEYYVGEVAYNNLTSNSKIQKIKLNEDDLLIDFENLIDGQFTGGNTGEEFENYKKFLKLSSYSKALCGGFVNFYRLKGKKKYYVLYSGINEISNSNYIVTLHKILTS